MPLPPYPTDSDLKQATVRELEDYLIGTVGDSATRARAMVALLFKKKEATFTVYDFQTGLPPVPPPLLMRDVINHAELVYHTNAFPASVEDLCPQYSRIDVFAACAYAVLHKHLRWVRIHLPGQALIGVIPIKKDPLTPPVP